MTMDERRAALRESLLQARKKIFFHSFLSLLVRIVPLTLLCATCLVTIDQRWGGGGWSVLIVSTAVIVSVFVPLVVALSGLGTLFRSARTIDRNASLKGRISSAWLFLSEGELDGPRVAQVENAIVHARALNYGAIFFRRRSGLSFLTPVFALLLVASFFVPAYAPLDFADAAVDSRKAIQLNELRGLQEELEKTADDEDVDEVVERLREIERRYESGDLAERDMMIELARLDEELQNKMNQLGVAQLSQEMPVLIPQMMASAASRPTAEALKKDQMERAAEEMEKLAERVSKNDLSASEKERLANAMGVAASKIGDKQQGSFSGDLASASEALKNSDSKSFSKSSKSMGNKFKSIGKYRKMKRMKNRMNMSKFSLGQNFKECASCNGGGCAACDGTGKSDKTGLGEGGGKGGLKAGTKATGDPFGNASRLDDSYREMLEVSGMAGDGPVDSEVETTAGQTSESQLAPRDLYTEYAEVAEQAIEREEIPLSHRFHVKRYFQAIRPVE